MSQYWTNVILLLITNAIESNFKSNSWYHTAGLALLLVRGNKRVPAPPPNMIEATFFGSAFGVSKSGSWNDWNKNVNVTVRVNVTS